MAKIASPRFKAVYDAADRVVELIWNMQVPMYLRAKESEDATQYHERIGLQNVMARLNDGDAGEEARYFIMCLDEYRAELKDALCKIDAAVSELQDAIEAPEVRESLRKVNPVVARVGDTPDHSSAEALLSLAWRYIGNLRMRAWQDDPSDKVPFSSHRSHELAEDARFLKLFPRMVVEDLSGIPPIFTRDVMTAIEKEVLQATALLETPVLDPWAVDMLALFEARGGHLTDNERDIYEIVKTHDGLITTSAIESALASKYGDAKTGSASNSLAFLTRCTILTKGPGGRGYKLAGGSQP